MKLLKTGAIAALSLVLGSVAIAQSAQTDTSSQEIQVTGRPWPKARWRGPGPMPRHHMALMWGIPAPYATMTNPAPRTAAMLQRGATLYAQNCLSCHGKEGKGDGEAGRNLRPAPGNLVWLSDMPAKQWDAFTYWTVAEGGVQLGTGMPAFKDTLSRDDIWAVTAYIQANMPFESRFK